MTPATSVHRCPAATSPAGAWPRPQRARGRLLKPAALAAAALGQALASLAWAQDAPQRVEIVARHYDNAVGTTDAASQGAVRQELLDSRPASRPGELLEFVPGVIVTQHSAEGKANQYFLRGFNLDHGTDFATSVQGVPVNQPSHGHGQGYADLNFLVPELVDRIEYRKGPYFARSGDFSSAGSAEVRYRTKLDAPLATLTLGQHRYQRLLAGGSSRYGATTTLLGAVEVQRQDGPWTVPEDAHKVNAVLQLAAGDAAAGWVVTAMHHRARWTATDQVPQRLLDAGVYEGRPFGRFDSLDPTDGGQGRRSSLSAQWHRSDGAGDTTRAGAYLIDYRLQLYSNFTYAMERPETGDQFSQRDDRRVAGGHWQRELAQRLGALEARTEWGLQLRHDRAQVGLFDTQARQLLFTVRDDRVRQTQAGAHLQTELQWQPWLRTVTGLRADHLRARVHALAQPANSGAAAQTLLSPKLSVVLGPWHRTEFFINAGRGFHSNDARGATARVDPRSGEPVGRAPLLADARGFELGARSEWVRGLQSSLALWRLDSSSELVYVGDAGTTEPQGASRRYGVEWSNRYIPVPSLLIDADIAWTHARFRSGDSAGQRIPNAVDKVVSAAVTWRDADRWSASAQWRYLGTAALTEDNSVRSRPSLTTNLRATRQLGRQAEVVLDVFNLFDRRVDDIQYVYESQLRGEAAPVADRHVHPALPRTWRLTLKTRF